MMEIATLYYPYHIFLQTTGSYRAVILKGVKRMLDSFYVTRKILAPERFTRLGKRGLYFAGYYWAAKNGEAVHGAGVKDFKTS
jgi:hypothetical protein